MTVGPSNQPPAATQPSPIADLSYRNYDGPLKARVLRWWVVSLYTFRFAMKSVFFWILAVIALLPYVYHLGVFYIFRADVGVRVGMIPLFEKPRYALQFYYAMEWQLFWMLLIGLIIGAGTIANDNRSNALIVYLSKPITKGDYLLGKWMGIFLVMLCITLIPGLIGYITCIMIFASDGFLKEEPWLIVQILAGALVAPAIFASVIVGISAWSKSGVMAGAFIAGIYILSGIVSGVLTGIFYRGDQERILREGGLISHCSFSGIIRALLYDIYGISTGLVKRTNPDRTPAELVYYVPPNTWIILAIALSIVILGIAAARFKIRAVEVVRG
jgi:ABC-2 type transport system permease protein